MLIRRCESIQFFYVHQSIFGAMDDDAVLSTGNSTTEDEEESIVRKEIKVENVKYPKGVFFIIINEICERYAFYGFRTILSLYLQQKLAFSETGSTLIYHAFTMVCYFFPILGAIIADSYWGKYKTILYLSILYAVGSIMVTVSSTNLWLQPESIFSLLGLLLVSLGSGGVKPCISAFGGDQFVLPQQEREMMKFFSVFYFAINIGSLVSQFVTPELREDITCFGKDTCYPLAFAVSTAFITISILVFVAGKWAYKVKVPTGNVIVDVVNCTTYAVAQKVRSKETTKKEHWLDYSVGKFSPQMIKDIKILMSIIVLLSPSIFFWSLFEQQGTTWTFQATRMDGKVGPHVIKPDQMRVVNSILCLFFIPLFDSIIYPILGKLKLVRTPLQKLVLGQLLAAAAFFMSAILEKQVEPTFAVLPGDGQAQLRIFNGYNCNLNVEILPKNTHYTLYASAEKLGILEWSLNASMNETVKSSLTLSCSDRINWKGEVNVTERQGVSYLLSGNKTEATLYRLGDYDRIEKSIDGDPLLRIIYDLPNNTKSIKLVKSDSTEYVNFILDNSKHATDTKEIKRGKYSLSANGTKIGKEMDIEYGAVYSMLVVQSGNQIEYRLFTITPPTSVHILWQVPQIATMAAAEIVFTVTGYQFCYSQSPLSMKSMISSVWLLADSLGNVVVIFIAEVFQNYTHATQFFIFTGLMLIITGIFIILSIRYKYRDPEDDEKEETIGKSAENINNNAEINTQTIT